MRAYAPKRQSVTITVAGGTGTGTIYAAGFVNRTLVDAPAAATWTLAVKDIDGIYVTGRTAQTDDLVFIERYPANGKLTFLFTSSTNGTYTIYIWEDEY